MKKLTEDIRVVALAISKSQELLQVSEDLSKVRRTTPLPEAGVSDDKLVFVKGFPLLGTSLDDLQEFFAPITKALSIRMLKYEENGEKKFKGALFLECSSPEEAKRVAALALKYKETSVLELLTHEAYLERKKQKTAAYLKSKESKSKSASASASNSNSKKRSKSAVAKENEEESAAPATEVEKVEEAKDEDEPAAKKVATEEVKIQQQEQVQPVEDAQVPAEAAKTESAWFLLLCIQ